MKKKGQYDVIKKMFGGKPPEFDNGSFGISLKDGKDYEICGFGDLTFNADPKVGNKKGLGCCVIPKGSRFGETHFYCTQDEWVNDFIYLDNEKDYIAFKRWFPLAERRDVAINKILS